MSRRIPGALMGADKAFRRGQSNEMLDLRYGGMMGLSPDLSQWVSNQQYVRANLIPVLIAHPSGMDYLPNPEQWIGTLRALVELHPVRITGLSAGLNIEVAGTPSGGAGHQHEDFTNVTETQSNIVFTWNEKYGMPVFRFLSAWVRLLMMDPHSKVAGINTFVGNTIPDMLADRYAMTMAFIEPDRTHSKVVKSWLVTNMFPKDSIENTSQRDITAPGETQNYDVAFTGLPQYGTGVDAFCQKLLDNISIIGANPYNRAAFVTGISQEVAAQGFGYESNVEALGRTAIKV